MHLGAVLVLIGVILAVLALASGGRVVRGRESYAAPLLAAAVVLIGIGVLIGRTTVS